MHTRTSRFPPLVLAVGLIAACGGDGGAAETSRAPERSGEVWEVDRVEDRAVAEAALLAYVSGLHVVVLDDDDAFAGMTRLRLTNGDGGGRSITLANGVGAQIVPAGEVLELRFAGGQTVPLRRQAPRQLR